MKSRPSEQASVVKTIIIGLFLIAGLNFTSAPGFVAQVTNATDDSLEIRLRPRTARGAFREQQVSRGAAGTAVENALGSLRSLGENASPVSKGAPVVPGKIKSGDSGQPGMVGSGKVPNAGPTPPPSSAPHVPEKPEFNPPQLCEFLPGLIKQLSDQSQENAQSRSQSRLQRNSRAIHPQLQAEGQETSIQSRSVATRASFSPAHSKNYSSDSFDVFGFGSPTPSTDPPRIPFSTEQSYQYVGSALFDDMCVEHERTPEEIEQLAEALHNIEKDQELQQQQSENQQQNSGQGQGPSGFPGLGNPFGGGGGPGGSPKASGDGAGKNPWADAYRDTSRPESLKEINEDPELIDRLTDEELLELIKDLENIDLCEELSEEAKKKLKERLEEIEEKEEHELSDAAKEIQQLIATDGTKILQTLKDAWKLKNNTTELVFTKEGQSMIDAINDSVNLDGKAKHYGNEARVKVGQLANDIMNSDMSNAEKASALGSLRYTVYQQQSDALYLSGQNPGTTAQNWSNFHHNVGLMSEGLSDRLKISQADWKQSSTTPQSSVREFLKYSGYPGATNVNQGRYGSCWLCPTTSLNYRVNPGELAMMQNQGLTTGSIKSPWTGQIVNVSSWLQSSDNALYDENATVQNLRSPLITMDQEAMAMFAGYNRAGGGGNPYKGLAGAHAYTGGVSHALVGSGVGAGFLTSGAFQQMAWAPGHYWSKDIINGTRVDSNGNYTAHSTIIGNNSWGSDRFETAHAFTPEGLASIRMPGGIGGLGGGGGGGLGGALGGLGGGPGSGGGPNGQGGEEPTANPLDDPEVRECLAHICSDIASQDLELPEICSEVELVMDADSQALDSAEAAQAMSEEVDDMELSAQMDSSPPAHLSPGPLEGSDSNRFRLQNRAPTMQQEDSQGGFDEF